MSLSPRGWSIRAGEKAMSYVQDVRNLETIQPVRVSQTWMWESFGDQHAKSLPSGEYLGEEF